jgi:hypothetical protein
MSDDHECKSHDLCYDDREGCLLCASDVPPTVLASRLHNAESELADARHERDEARAVLADWLTEQTGLVGERVLKVLEAARAWKNSGGPATAPPAVALEEAIAALDGREGDA